MRRAYPGVGLVARLARWWEELRFRWSHVGCRHTHVRYVVGRAQCTDCGKVMLAREWV